MEASLHGESAVSIGGRLTSLREKLLQDITATVTAMIADAEAAARQAVDDARQQFETAEQELHRQLTAALVDLEQQRNDAGVLKHQLAIERAAKERAEASYTAAQVTQQQVAAGYTERIGAAELELEAARREAGRLASELETESAERRRLAAILDSIRSAVGGTTTSTLPPSPSGPSHTDTQQAPAAAAVVASDEVEEEPPSSPDRSLKFVSRAPAEPNVELADCARQLLDEVHASYQANVESLQGPSDVVNRLVTELRTARELFLMRCNDDEALANEEFDRQISLVLDTNGASAFGRHLGIAWYEISQPAERAAPYAVA